MEARLQLSALHRLTYRRAKRRAGVRTPGTALVLRKELIMKDLLGAVGIWLMALVVAGLLTPYVPTDGLTSALFGVGMSWAGATTAVSWYRARRA